MKLIFLLVLLVLASGLKAQKLNKIWSVSDGLLTPESVLYDASSDVIFVSNINGDPTAKDGNGFISLLKTDGKIEKLDWVTGLNAPKGQAIFEGNYYVSDIDELVVIRIEDAKIIKRYKAENAVFLNDVTVAEDGQVFVSDSRDNKVYALQNEKLVVWLEHELIDKPNGLWAEKGSLYVGTANILNVNIQTRKISVLVENCGGIDGLEKMSDGNFIYSNWPGRIFITKGTKSVELLNTLEEKNTADIDFIPGKNLVIVPTFRGNGVDAYLLKH